MNQGMKRSRGIRIGNVPDPGLVSPGLLHRDLSDDDP